MIFKLMTLIAFSVSVTFAIYLGFVESRVAALEATIEKPELIHTCNLYDDKQRKLCGWIEVE